MAAKGSTSAAARAAAAQAVHRVIDEGRNLDEALAASREGLPQRAHAELQAWCYGTLRWWPRIECQLAALSTRPLKDMDPLALALLGVALFQIQHSPIPPHAVVDESVAATRLLGCARASGFVNALLRRYMRERESIDARVLAKPAGRFAHADWLIESLRKDWPDDYARMLDANNEHPPLWLRVNRRKIEIGAYLQLLTDAGLDARHAPRIATAACLEKAVGVDAIPGFTEGKVSVQDAGAQLAAPMLDARPGHRVLDACAAPGGKTCHIAEHTADLALLLAIDRDAERVELIRENLGRLGLNATLAAADAAQPGQWWDGRPFDRILLDVPCSATGVIRRHPDIKILRRPEDIPAFARLQTQLLSALWPLLVPGGRLVYATCSILNAENSGVIVDFLSAHGDARAVLPDRALARFSRSRPGEPGLYLIVGEAGTDGFYYACLEKTTTTVTVKQR